MTTVELLVGTGTNVYSYTRNSDGSVSVGNLIRTDNAQQFTLDLYPDEVISFTLQIAQVQDPTTKTTSFSKNFFIPGTQNNNRAMDYAFNPIVDAPWRIGKPEIVGNEYRVPVRNAYLSVDGVMTFSGSLELLNSTIDQGNIVSYEVFFLGTESSVFDLWQTVNLCDLPFDGMNFQITGTPGNYYAAMANTDADATFAIGGTGSSKGFTFGYPDWGFPIAPVQEAATGPYQDVGYNTSEATYVWTTGATAPSDPRECNLRFGYNVLPYVYIKNLVDQMFTLAGYRYDSEFFKSVDFRKMLMLYYNREELSTNLFMKLASQNPAPGSTPNGYFPDQDGQDLNSNYLAGRYDFEQVPTAFGFDGNERCEDLYETYQGDAAYYFPRAGTWTIQVKANITIRWGWDQNGSGCSSGCGGPDNYYPHSTYPLLGSNSRLIFSNPTRGVTVEDSIFGLPRGADAAGDIYIKDGNSHCSWETQFNAYTTPLEFTITTLGPETWYLYMLTDAEDYYDCPVEFGCPAFPVQERLYQSAIDAVIEDVTPLVPNWCQTVPSITCHEFFAGLVKHFNLFVQVDANSRTMTIEDRDRFFTNGDVTDWSKKIDISTQRQISNFTPPKNVYLKFTETDNWLDIQYQGKSTNTEKLPYGSVKIENSYGDGDTTFESPFSAPCQYWAETVTLQTSPIIIGVPSGYKVKFPQTVSGVTSYYTVPVLALYPKDDSGRVWVETSPYFIAYNNGFVTLPQIQVGGVWQPVYANISTLTNSSILTNNMGTRSAHVISAMNQFTGTTANQSKVLLYTDLPSNAWSGGIPPGAQAGRSQNIYEFYFENYIENLNDTKLYTVKATLTNRDIGLFQFRDPVFLDLNGDGQYYIVNKIDVSPTDNGVANVELATFNPLYFDFDVDNSIPEYPYEPIPPSE